MINQYVDNEGVIASFEVEQVSNSCVINALASDGVLREVCLDAGSYIIKLADGIPRAFTKDAFEQSFTKVE